MANIFIKNLYFGGINNFPDVKGTEETEEPCDDLESSSEIVSIDPEFMTKTIASVEHIDPETVRKVFAGADLFLRSIAELKGSGHGE